MLLSQRMSHCLHINCPILITSYNRSLAHMTKHISMIRSNPFTYINDHRLITARDPAN